MLAFWQPVLMTGAGITLQGQRLGYGPDDTSHWEEASSECAEPSFLDMANFLLFFFHVPLAVLLPCHSTMFCPSFYQSLVKPSFSAHFGYRLYQFLCMYITYNVCIQMSVLHSLNSYTCVSL